MSEISKTNREYEAFLFDSVPEVADTTYQRDASSKAEIRQSGKPLAKNKNKPIVRKGEIVCTYSYNPNTHQVEFRPLSP